ncbi:MAG: cyclic nucleotide-binding domain-containing protein [Elusimicrobiota bacterium]|jgi:CRP-like cAMP-binding protein
MSDTHLKLNVHPKDLDWLAHALKLSETMSDAPALESLLESLPAISLESWPAGVEVLREGDAGEDFFVVYSGELSVRRNVGKTSARTVGRLESGDFFGEIGFLLKSARSATVRTESECHLFRFPSEEFAAMLKRHKLLERWVKHVACKRIADMFLGNGR